MNTFAYSATKKSAKRMLEYSMLKPATSSDSASGMSNGVRLSSASMPMKNSRNANGCVTMFQTRGLRLDDRRELHRPGEHDDADRPRGSSAPRS